MLQVELRPRHKIRVSEGAAAFGVANGVESVGSWLSAAVVDVDVCESVELGNAAVVWGLASLVTGAADCVVDCVVGVEPASVVAAAD